jgi:hypothetical protein
MRRSIVRTGTHILRCFWDNIAGTTRSKLPAPLEQPPGKEQSRPFGSAQHPFLMIPLVSIIKRGEIFWGLS